MQTFLCLLLGFLGGCIAFLMIALILGISIKRTKKKKEQEIMNSLGDLFSLMNNFKR